MATTLPGRLTRVLAAATVLLLLAGCGGDDTGAGAASEVHTAGNGDRYNDADVRFATEMIQHHAQALAMVDLTMGEELSPPVQQLAEDIRAAQGPEVELMSDWLTAWDEPVPETVRDHSNAHGGGHGGDDSGMPGMMTEEQMSELDAAEGAELEQLWLSMMIEHHEGAVEMARTEQEEGEFGPAVELAATIEAAQEQEIAAMEALLAS